jgi:ABC-type Na+ efflux pump permease subunit
MAKKLFSNIRKEKVSTVFKKDLRELFKSKEIVLTLIIMPIVFAILVPSSMIALNFSEGMQDNNQEFLDVFSNISVYWPNLTDLQKTALVQVNLNLTFLLIIPMMVPMAICGDSIAGEKERKTIEGLLAAPISESEILLGKALASTLPTIVISWLAEIIYIIYTDIILYNLMGKRIILPNLFAVIMFFIIIPTQTIFSTVLMTRISSKSAGSKEALQRSSLVNIPFLLLSMALFFFPLFIHPLVCLGSATIMIVLTILTLLQAAKNINRDMLLTTSS